MKKLKRIPFCPMPLDKAIQISRKLYFISRKMGKIAPHLDTTLKQAKIPIEKKDYVSVSLFSAVFMSVLFSVLMLVLSSIVVELMLAVTVSGAIGLTLFFVILMYLMQYPKLFVRKRVNEMERNLMPGLKHIYIQLRSGVPVYDSFLSLSEGGYGTLSEEFSHMIQNVETGSNIEDEMDEMAIRNPSPYLRRALWQISNGMKSGSDMGIVLSNIIENISREQMLAIRRYGSQLNPLTLVYMMMAVIIPALGITMLIVLSSFSGLEISETMMFGILGGLAFFQFMYIGVIKSKRPNV